MGKPRIEQNGERITITDRSLDESERAGSADRFNGAVLEFRGVVRDHNGGRQVTGIRYDCHRELAMAETGRLADEIEAEFGVHVARIAHRTGELVPGEISLVVSIRSAHRAAALAAMTTLIDRFKERVPIWKKERYADDSSAWL
jgi:molybdopterin synthase catalytic subunit